jgi:hypothetical protein
MVNRSSNSRDSKVRKIKMADEQKLRVVVKGWRQGAEATKEVNPRVMVVETVIKETTVAVPAYL